MAVRTARTAWNGTLMEGEGQVELTTSGTGTFDVTFPRRIADDAGQLHGEAGGVRGGDELLGARCAVGVLRRALGEGHVEGGDAGAGELDLAAALVQGPVPGGASGARGHGCSFDRDDAGRPPAPPR